MPILLEDDFEYNQIPLPPGIATPPVVPPQTFSKFGAFGDWSQPISQVPAGAPYDPTALIQQIPATSSPLNELAGGGKIIASSGPFTPADLALVGGEGTFTPAGGNPVFVPGEEALGIVQGTTVQSGQGIPEIPIYQDTGGAPMALAGLGAALIPQIPGLISGLTGSLGLTTGGKSSLTGATVVATGRGYIVLQTSTGRRVTIQRKKHSRRRFHQGGGMGLNINRMMQYHMMKSLLK